jgi:hypothetical protein
MPWSRGGGGQGTATTGLAAGAARARAARGRRADRGRGRRARRRRPRVAHAGCRRRCRRAGGRRAAAGGRADAGARLAGGAPAAPAGTRKPRRATAAPIAADPLDTTNPSIDAAMSDLGLKASLEAERVGEDPPPQGEIDMAAAHEAQAVRVGRLRAPGGPGAQQYTPSGGPGPPRHPRPRPARAPPRAPSWPRRRTRMPRRRRRTGRSRWCAGGARGRGARAGLEGHQRAHLAAPRAAPPPPHAARASLPLAPGSPARGGGPRAHVARACPLGRAPPAPARATTTARPRPLPAQTPPPKHRPPPRPLSPAPAPSPPRQTMDHHPREK